MLHGDRAEVNECRERKRYRTIVWLDTKLAKSLSVSEIMENYKDEIRESIGEELKKDGITHEGLVVEVSDVRCDPAGGWYLILFFSHPEAPGM